MAKIRAKERVAASFHYLNIKIVSEDGSDPLYEGFSQEQLQEFKSRILTCPPLDLSDDQVKDMVRFKRAVPLEHIEEIDERTIFGRYRGAYWGHGYENTHAGYIPPDSISLRPFYFLIYLSSDGKIYVGTQYLGQFGSYTGLKNSLKRLIAGNCDVSSHSFRSEAANLENLVPKEVKVTVSSATKNASADNVVKSERLTLLKPLRRGSPEQESVKRTLISRFKQPELLKSEISKILKKNEIISFDDEDIVDCVVVAELNGRPFVMHFMEEGVRATQFEIKGIVYEKDGHPTRACVKQGMIDLLENKILVNTENA